MVAVETGDKRVVIAFELAEYWAPTGRALIRLRVIGLPDNSTAMNNFFAKRIGHSVKSTRLGQFTY